MPDFLVLLSTLGGLTLFGLSGFIAGPAIAALFITAVGHVRARVRILRSDDETTEAGSLSPGSLPATASRAPA